MLSVYCRRLKSCSHRDDINWRWGVDVGGRYGTGKVNFHEINHLTGVLWGAFGSVHSDIEIPCRCCILQAGLRLEYSYTLSDILQEQNSGDIQQVNLLFTLGSRF